MDFSDIVALLTAHYNGNLKAGLATRYKVAASDIVVTDESIQILINKDNPSLPQARSLTGEEILLILG